MHYTKKQSAAHTADDQRLDLLNRSQSGSDRSTRRVGTLASRGRSFVLFLTLGLLAATGLQANPFYVAPNGNDANPGTEAQPFRTIERARTAVRAATASQTGDITVFIRGGRYELNETLRFDGNDSGRNGHRVIYRAFPGETPSISGGRRVTGWTHFRDGIFRAPSPVPAYRQLYVNGQRGVRARTPNSNFHRLIRWDGDKTIRIPGHLIHNWSNLNEVEMVVMKHWNHSRFRIGSFHRSGDTASVVPREPERSVEWIVQWPNREGNEPFFFENSLDFLDAPGEWYLHKGQQQVYYMPRPGEDINNAEIIVPRLERVLEIRGASNLQFIGLTFEHTNWTAVDNEGFVGIQAGGYRVLTTGMKIPSGITLENTQNVRLERNVVRNFGNGGIELHSGTFRTEVIGNAVADVGGNGIAIYTLLSNRNPPDHIRSRGDIIRNNFITRAGQDYPGTVGIFASYTAGMIVEHNEITDLPYTAINMGWGWTNQDTGTRDNVIRYNRIHNVVNLLDDGAGIYTLSKQSGTLIEENHIHNMVRNPWAGYYEIAGLYLDEQSEGITMRNNVVQNLSGVLVWKQNRANTNWVHTNGNSIPNQQNIINRAGLEPAFREIRNGVNQHIAPVPTNGPFFGTATPFPGRVEAENYDYGGPGVAYHDTTSFNQGGQYRHNEFVDIEQCSDGGGGHNVGWTEAGEWLQYTVDVKTAGTYDIRFRVATTQSNRAMHLKVDGRDVTGRINVPNTGGWQQWQTVTVANIALEAGQRVFRLHTDAGPFNINFFEGVLRAANQAPVTAITSPAANTSFTFGQPIAITATATDADGSIAKVEFFANGNKIGERSGAPYTFTWEAPIAGANVLTVRAIDNEGSATTSAPVTVNVAARDTASGPFNGSPASVPGRIEAEHFDHGGPGVAYVDTTANNQGSAFRLDESVDLQPTTDQGGGFNVAWTRPGEWLQYTVDVKASGTYDVHLRVATEQADRDLRILVDGKDVSGRVVLPNTTGWQTWRTVTVPNIALEAGTRRVRIQMESGDLNLNWFEFEAKSVNQVAAVTLTSPANGASFAQGSPVPMTAAVQDAGTVRVEFYAGTTKVGERTAAPYSIIWINAPTGKHTLTARAIDSSGISRASAPIEIEVGPLSTVNRRPFNSSPAQIPGRILAVEYDHGGPGVAYYDTTVANRGEAFRKDEQVDIEASTGGEPFSHNVGWVDSGEWMEYTVNVATAGTYQLSMRVASTMASGHLSVLMNGKDISGRINVPNTGGWQRWTTVFGPVVQLNAGQQVMRIAIGAPEFNIGFVEFQPVANDNATPGTFSDWQAVHFGIDLKNLSTIAGPKDDPDGDGVPNLMEYALNRDPLKPNRRDVTAPGQVTLNNQTYMTLTYTRRAGVSDVEFIVEISPDLQNWASGGGSVVPVSVTREGDVERVVVRDAIPLGQGAPRFMRLRLKQGS